MGLRAKPSRDHRLTSPYQRWNEVESTVGVIAIARPGRRPKTVSRYNGEMTEPAPINPYAPTSIEGIGALPSESVGSEREGVMFSGQLDVNEIRRTDHVAQGFGLVIGSGVTGVLAVAGYSATFMKPGSPMASLIFWSGALVTGLATWAFVVGQTTRPLRGFPWMSGSVTGQVLANRIDIAWDVGRASVLLPSLISTSEYINHQGRMFVCRGLCCFVPRHAVHDEAWRQLEESQTRRDRSDNKTIEDPPDPPADALTFDVMEPAGFATDYERHRRLRREASFVPVMIVFFLFLMLLAPINCTLLVLAPCLAILIVAWLLRQTADMRGAVRRPPRVRPERSSVIRIAPDYVRWLDDNGFLVGYADGWIQLPWNAIVMATVSEFGVDLAIGGSGPGPWFLERGRASLEDWTRVVHHVIRNAPQSRLFGRIRELGAASAL